MTVAGVNISPIAFLVVQAGNVKLLPVNHSSAVDKLLDYVPDAIEKVNSLINKQIDNKKEDKQKKEEKKNEAKEKHAEPEVEPKTEKVNQTVTRTRPRRGRARNNEVYEYEYNEVPVAGDILINAEDSEEFDDE